MSKRLSLTTSELKIIEDSIKDYPNNLTHAFEIAAQQLGLTKNQVQNQYYSNIKKNKTLLAVASTNGTFTIDNQKNAIRRNLTTLTDDDKYDIVINLVSKMSRQRKKDLVNVLFS